MSVWRLVKTFAQLELMDRMSSPVAFMLISCGTVLRIFLVFVFYQALFSKVQTIGGWGYDQVLVLQGVWFLIECLSWASYTRGFNRLPRIIESGSMDWILIRPVQLPGFFVYRYLDVLFCWPQIFSSLGMIGYGLYVSGQSFWVLLPLASLIVCSLVLHYSVILLLSCINFYHIVGQIFYLFGEVSRLGRYPIDMYKGGVKIFLSTFVPLAFVYSVPVQFVFGQLTWQWFIFTFVFTFLFYQFAQFMWRRALARYESAS